MKGFADIVLYDKDGNIVKEQHDDNFITNAFKEYLEAYNVLISNPTNRIADDIRRITHGMQLQKLIGGIVLFENKLPEDVNITHNDVLSVASAGTAYDYTNPLRGSLNTQETGATEIDGKTAYRWVWDFGTANANCTFNACSLTTKYAGDRNYRLNVDTDLFNNNNKTSYNHGWKIGNQYDFWAMDKQGYFIKKQNDSLTVEEFVTTKKITESGQLISNTVLTENTHEWFSHNTHIINDSLFYIAKNKETTEFELIELDLTTKTKKTTIELTGIKNSVTSTINVFGFCGENSIVFNPKYSSGKLYLSFFNLTTKEFIFDKNTNINIAGGIRTGEFISFKTANNKLASTLSTFTTAAGSAGYNYAYAMFQVFSENDIYLMFNDTTNVSDPTSTAIPFVRTFNNTSMLLAISDSYYGYQKRGGLLWPSGMEPLFTINNLQNPITKTEANTMKITYTLIYE